MGRPSMVRVMRAGLVLAVTAAVGGCGSGGITASRVEDALAPTFANLIHVQESLLGLPPVDAAALRASASCHKTGPGSDAGGGAGAGNWLCTVGWFIPGRKSPVHDTYDLSVTTDGCYTATVDGAEGHLGGPTLTARDGTPITNLLYAFDGCFDTT